MIDSLTHRVADGHALELQVSQMSRTYSRGKPVGDGCDLNLKQTSMCLLSEAVRTTCLTSQTKPNSF